MTVTRGRSGIRQHRQQGDPDIDSGFRPAPAGVALPEKGGKVAQAQSEAPGAPGAPRLAELDLAPTPALPVGDVDEPLLTAEQAAWLLQVSKRHIFNLRTRGVMRAVAGIGSVVRFRAADVRALMQNTVVPTKGRRHG